MNSKVGTGTRVLISAGLAGAALLGISTPAIAEPGPTEVIVATTSGRAVTATRYGPADATTSVVVIGQMHGGERAGRRVVGELAGLLGNPAAVPWGAAIWLISTMNPDGAAAGTRTNSSGVDLNRNFRQGWRQQGRGTSSWSGPSAASEAETVGMMAFLAEVNPAAVLSFHQPFDMVDITHPASRAAGRRLATWLGVPARVVGCPGPCYGTLTGWVTDQFGAVALTVELPAQVSGGQVERSATAVVRLTKWLAR